MRPAASALPCALSLLLAGAPAFALDCPEGQRPFTDVRGEICIPADPQRIVSLHDMTVTLPLLELGAPVVGSMGRIDAAGNRYMRSVDLVLGLDFESAGLGYIGAWEEFDYEAVAALAPDLIIGSRWDADYAERMGRIAPVVLVPDDPADAMSLARGVADAGGVLDRFEAEMARYEANLARVRAALPEAQGMTYAEVQADGGTLYVFTNFGASTKVLRDLGLVPNALTAELLAQGVADYAELTAEVLPRLEADVVLDSFTLAYGDSMQSPRERMAEVIPGWCDLLPACSEDRYVVLPRELTGISFRELDMMLVAISTNLARILHRPSAPSVPLE
ncbi:ABC-type Fe3+-hydroxamate transport system, periplasmic component [Rubellimicrobium thermophilum DSM 16684]|uniref:ABC-type Fe3+-hydroxamate transport system, periplasmic component n=1 Tax=Rubellimicrobium thermophilum DSM 16684 TaxID=1123069 RepID=S9S914_9RHOB|nr:ABC transporter substrate-binding protein [Rubellimicrobium thermophilum]EPX82759.1 ABC-type Fe3+-hydroxamate transport system, periplasmic component [Rubellimicrobium thermophilum DSM 16684]